MAGGKIWPYYLAKWLQRSFVEIAASFDRLVHFLIIKTSQIYRLDVMQILYLRYLFVLFFHVKLNYTVKL